MKGHTTRIWRFCSLQSIQQLTAPNWNPAACLSCAFLLDRSPWPGKHTYCMWAQTHTHGHAEILAHNNQPQHEHPRTNTHLNNMVTHSTRHKWLSQPLSNSHHNTARTVKASLQGVARCGDGNRWNCSSSSRAGKVKRNWTSSVNVHVCFSASLHPCPSRRLF